MKLVGEGVVEIKTEWREILKKTNSCSSYCCYNLKLLQSPTFCARGKFIVIFTLITFLILEINNNNNNKKSPSDLFVSLLVLLLNFLLPVLVFSFTFWNFSNNKQLFFPLIPLYRWLVCNCTHVLNLNAQIIKGYNCFNLLFHCINDNGKERGKMYESNLKYCASCIYKNN